MIEFSPSLSSPFIYLFCILFIFIAFHIDQTEFMIGAVSRPLDLHVTSQAISTALVTDFLRLEMAV
jgi:hypothetical protein